MEVWKCGSVEVWKYVYFILTLPHFHTPTLSLLSWNLLLPLCRIINKSSNYCCSLFQILSAQMIIIVHITMMGPASIFHGILNKLEFRQTNSVESKIVRSTSILQT